MVAYHPAEPAHLVALVGDVFADIGRGYHRDSQRLGVPTSGGCRLPDRGDGPLGDLWVSQLQHESVGLPAAQVQRLGSVGGHPHGERAVVAPRKGLGGAVVLNCVALGQTLDHSHGLLEGGQVAGFLPYDPHGRITATDAAHCALAVHVVEGGKQ